MKAATSNQVQLGSPVFLSTLRPIFWIALYLAAIEIGLEYRAYLRGWDTALFGAVRSEHSLSNALDGSAPRFGPTAESPFRGPLIKSPRQANELRIWVASASHGEDIYVPPQSIFPTLIGEELRQKGILAQVLNASRAGTAIQGDLARLTREFDIWRPDVVVLYQLSLDVGLLSRRFLGPARSRATETGSDAETQTTPRNEPSWAARLFRESTAYSLLNANITTRVSAARILSDDIGADARKAFRRILVDFVDGIRDLGADPVLCTFATSVSPSASTPIPRDVELFVYRWNEHLSARGWLAAIEQLNGVIRDVATEKRALHVDAAAQFTGREEIFRDPVHFSLAGHRALAVAIASALTRSAVRD